MSTLPSRRLLTLLLASTMTVMAGATISPSLPAIRETFSEAPRADLLVRLVLTIPAIFTAVGAPLAGYLIDRFGRKRLLLVAMVLYGIGGAGGGLASSIWVLLGSRAFLGLSVGGVMTTATTLIADYYEGERRSAVMGQQAAFMGFGGVVFLVLGGVLADLSWRAPFGIYLLAFVFLPGAAWYLNEPSGSEAGREEAEETSATPGRADSAVQQQVPWGLVGMLFALAFVGMVVFYMTPVQIPFYLETLGAGSGTLAGLAVAASTITGALASMAYGRVKGRVGYRGVFALLFALMAGGYTLVALASGFALATGGLAVLGLGMGLLMPNLNNWAGEVAPQAKRGKVLGGVTTCIFLGQFASPIATQPVIDAVGLAGAFGVAGGAVGLLALGFAAWSALRRSEAKPRGDLAAAAAGEKPSQNGRTEENGRASSSEKTSKPASRKATE
jgi:MFS family permease